MFVQRRTGEIVKARCHTVHTFNSKITDAISGADAVHATVCTSYPCRP